jgi:hypothetical protein
VNTKHRLLASLWHVEDARAVLTIVLLAFDRDQHENLRLFAFWKTVVLPRHDHSVAGSWSGSRLHGCTPERHRISVTIRSESVSS